MLCGAVSAAEPPNLFELRGPGIRVEYSTTSLDGTPRFHYQTPRLDLDFSGEQIEVSESPLGTLVSVTIETVPDLRSVVFSIVLPPFNLGEDDRAARVDTIGIYSTWLTSIGGPALVR